MRELDCSVLLSYWPRSLTVLLRDGSQLLSDILTRIAHRITCQVSKTKCSTIPIHQKHILFQLLKFSDCIIYILGEHWRVPLRGQYFSGYIHASFVNVRSTPQ